MDRYRAEISVRFPELDHFHILNESLLTSTLAGEPRAAVYNRAMRQLLLVAEAGADFIMMTCPTCAPAADITRLVCTTPIVNIMDPVALEAVRSGRRIALLSTDPTATGPTAALLRQHAAAQGQEIIVEAVVRPEAYTALHAGDVGRHDAILTEAGLETLLRCDVLVLVETASAHLKQALSGTGKPVLDTPSLLMAEIGRRLAIGCPAV